MILDGCKGPGTDAKDSGRLDTENPGGLINKQLFIYIGISYN
jgi:hypothetical protein